MSTFLVTWNPSKWYWDPADYAATVTRTGRGRAVAGGWSVGNRRRGIHRGDRAFLLRQESDRGIIGSGTFTDGVYPGAHWDGSGRQANYANFDWDVLLLSDDRLPIEDLMASVLPFHWERVQAGGILIPAPADQLLEDAWADHLRFLGRSPATTVPRSRRRP
jgi:hypothetical protein